ncbi:hypothetical protein [Gorillibacterium massiliense]|uniref:hypothetical protein n=1 Tax=Gorillibacterium massiliense TaxID=1280390 RepID=UPI00059545DC|nr:hypothetical protein [Gorillibacterium massiliense]
MNRNATLFKRRPADNHSVRAFIFYNKKNRNGAIGDFLAEKTALEAQETVEIEIIPKKREILHAKKDDGTSLKPV